MRFNLTQKFIHFKNIYGLGEGQVGFIKNIINVSGALHVLNFIKLYFPQYADSFLTLAPIAIAGYIVTGLVVGTVLDKKLKMVQQEQRWANSRDPQIVEIIGRLKRIEQKVK